jgi:hypothetical protein
MPALTEALKDPDRNVRRVAATVLGGVQDAAVALGPVTADQSRCHVGLRLARSGGVLARWHSVWFCLFEPPGE